MDVIAFVGPSGTGKSHRALLVAHQHQADAIIDDGILIKDGKIVAGSFAKMEKSKIMAVRRAIFTLPGHAEEVRSAIAECRPHRILVLGTSENMVYKIARILKLPTIEQIIHIEDIATQREMQKARDSRLKQGKHIIPVPTIELKPHASGFLIDPIQSFFRRSRTRRRKLGEKSIVRPVFSYYGKLIIDDLAIREMVVRIVREKEYISKVGSVRVRHVWKGDEDRGLEISCSVVLTYGSHIPTLIKETQQRVRTKVEYMTGLFVREVDIMVQALYIEA